MTETPGEAEQPGPLDALRSEHHELRQRVEKIDILQLKSAKNKRAWYREPSLLIATLALIVSLGTVVVGQLNLSSEREIDDRNRLSALIEQLPNAEAMAHQTQNPNNDLVFLIGDTAAELMDKLSSEASTASEKIEVATALIGGYNLAGATKLATEAEQQSTVLAEKISAEHILASIDFQTGNTAAARDMYRRIILQLQMPQKEADSPLGRKTLAVYIEIYWASDEFYIGKSCQAATEQLANAKRDIDQLPAGGLGLPLTSLNNVTKLVTAHCPSASGQHTLTSGRTPPTQGQ